MKDDSIYRELMQKDNMKAIDAKDYDINGVDGFLLPNKLKISSMADLMGFSRIGDDTLVHKAEKDLWNIKETSKGDVVIERLFDPNTAEALTV